MKNLNELTPGIDVLCVCIVCCVKLSVLCCCVVPVPAGRRPLPLYTPNPPPHPKRTERDELAHLLRHGVAPRRDRHVQPVVTAAARRLLLPRVVAGRQVVVNREREVDVEGGAARERRGLAREEVVARDLLFGVGGWGGAFVGGAGRRELVRVL